MISSTKDIDFWFYTIGVNIIPAVSTNKIPKVKWTEWQDKPIPDEVYEDWKKSGDFNDGCAIIAGMIWRGEYKGKFLTCIDIDNALGIKEFLSKFGKVDTLEMIAEKTIVEQHLDAKDKSHIYFIVEKPLSKKSGIGGPNNFGKTDIPAIEVKSEGKHGIIFCSPSVHKNGAPYQIIGTSTPTVLNKEHSVNLEYSIDEIYEDFGIALPSDNKIAIEELFKPDFEVREGNNRHLVLMRVMESLIGKLRNIYSEEMIKCLTIEWNEEHCKPPLDDKEFEKQWDCAKKYIFQKTSDDTSISTAEDGEKPTEKSIVNIPVLLDSIKKRWIEVFKDQFSQYHITIKVNNHIECIPLNSNRFTGIVRKEYFEKERKTISDDKLDAILKLLESELMFTDELKKIELSLRVAARKEEPNVFYYDLTNSEWEIVKISSKGWEVIKNNNLPLFKRYEGNCSPQVTPSSSLQDNKKGFDQFFKLFNLQSERDKILLTVYLIILFIPEIPKVILVVKGNGGGAKTTAFRMIKNIADPCNVDDFSFSKQINDVIQTLEHQHVVFFDNVSHISDEMSDLICRAVTGSGFSKRAHYTNDEDFLYKFKRCIGINGINLATTRPDFLDRSLVIKFKRIEENARRKEEDIKNEFERLRPFVLGYIFDTLVKALKYKEEHKEEKILKNGFPRMADFAEWGEILSRCVGNDENEFIDAYEENRLDQNDEVIEASPVAESILLFINERDKGFVWEGTPTKLHNVLTDIIDQIKPELRRSNLWPKGSNKLTSKINEVIPNLKEKGIDVITGERNKEGNRIIRIEKLRNRRTNLVEENKEFNPNIHRKRFSDNFECDK
ncbi:bifunctional DNA primase/polymerase [Candidatus Nitrosocosmicus sp. R]